ncbi:MAG: dipicolinate synthase subunit DpsA [Bacillota bacterium]
MEESLKDLKIAVIGGDSRELVLIKKLAALRAKVLLVGYDLVQLPEAFKKTDFKTALRRSDVIILPMSGIDEDGGIKAIFAQEALVAQQAEFDFVKHTTPILTGIMSSYLKNLAEIFDLNIIATAELDEIAILNSIPTAEGAIEIAIHEMEITLHGSNSLILGFGRVGKTLARMLKGIGTKVSITARKTVDLARITEQGYEAFTYQSISDNIGSMDVIFNTVPFLVLDDKLLKKLKPETIIIDLASNPGGVDTVSATERGLKVIHALGLPGKTAPLTAGQILCQAYPRIILAAIKATVAEGGVE